MKKILFILFCAVQCSYSQTAVNSSLIASLIAEETLVALEGKVLHIKPGQQNICMVELLFNNEILASRELNGSSNKFRFHLKPDCQYKIRISREGYMSRLISVKTKYRSRKRQKNCLKITTKLVKQKEKQNFRGDIKTTTQLKNLCSN